MFAKHHVPSQFPEKENEKEPNWQTRTLETNCLSTWKTIEQITSSSTDLSKVDASGFYHRHRRLLSVYRPDSHQNHRSCRS